MVRVSAAPFLGAMATIALLFSSVGDASGAWRQTRFLIGGWGVNDAPSDPDRLVRLQDAGLDYLQNFDHGFDARRGRLLVARLDSLRAARPGFHLQAVLHFVASRERPSGFTDNADPDANWPKIQQALDPAAGLNRPSTLGWFLWDEPCTRAEMDDVSVLARRILANPASADQVPFVNLIPIAPRGGSGCYESEFGKGLDRVGAYTAYLETYLAAFDDAPHPAPLLSFDHYPFQLDGQEDGSYFENLAIARDRALAHGRPGERVPLWVVVQLASFKPRDAPFMRNPSIAQVRWQAWTAVAYGAKSISYWTTGTTADPNPKSGYRGGLLELDGRMTSKYKAIRQLNAQLHALGPTLMALDPVAVFQVDAQSQFVPDRDRIGSKDRIYGIVSGVDGSGRADCMIGYFKHQQTADDYLLVVNKSLKAKRTFRIRLGSPADSIESFDGVSGRPRLVGRSTATFDVPALPPASAALYHLRGPLLEHLEGVRAVTRQGSVLVYELAHDALRVDYATGVRGKVPVTRAPPAPDFAITPRGVIRSPAWMPGPASGGP